MSAVAMEYETWAAACSRDSREDHRDHQDECALIAAVKLSHGVNPQPHASENENNACSPVAPSKGTSSPNR
eukprot:353707-Chlamydomonas_euryale.AAC.17